MAKQIIGRVTMMNRGEWNSSKTYDKLDIVSHNGSSYTPNRDGVSSEPPSGDWTIIAAKGERGIQGPKGDSGEAGTVTPAAAIADLTSAPTAGDFNALLNALRAAGLMARPTTAVDGPTKPVRIMDNLY